MLITVKKTGFHFTLEQIKNWLQLFGTVESPIEYKAHPSKPALKQDSLEVLMRLRKHILSTLPAYGKKLFIQYRGQPIQCSGCLEMGHVRKTCKNERSSWISYIKELHKTGRIPDSFFGSWIKSIANTPNQNDSHMEDLDESV